MKRTIEIEDTLDERVENAIDDVKNLLLAYLEDNPDMDSLPCLFNDLDYDGRAHEIADGAVPIYTSEIQDTWYLHKDALEEAYENAGVGNNPLENDGMAAIYFYIQEKINDWYNDNAQDIFDDWYEKEQKKICAECGKRFDNPEDLKNGICVACQEEEDSEEGESNV